MRSQAAIGRSPNVLAHTAKGVAGNIGATDAQAAAAELEHAFRHAEPQDRTNRALESLAQALGHTMGVIRQALDATAPVSDEPSPESCDPTLLRDTLARLAQLIEANDAEAADCLVMIRGPLTASAAKEIFCQAGEEPGRLRFRIRHELSSRSAKRTERYVVRDFHGECYGYPCGKRRF